jgi:hypothetical protein
MSVKAKVMIREKSNVLAVPYDLIRYDEDGNAYVLIAESNDNGEATAVRCDITVGDEVDYYTEVTGGTLQEGDLLICDYDGMISEGDVFAPQQLYSEQEFGGMEDTE